MGRASRRKRDRRPDAGAQFRTAMQEVESEDQQCAIEELQQFAESALGCPQGESKAVVFVLAILMEPRPWSCRGCQQPTSIVASWRPSDESLRRDFRLPPRHIAAVLYPICMQCQIEGSNGNHTLVNAVQEAVLAELHVQGLISSVAP